MRTRNYKAVNMKTKSGFDTAEIGLVSFVMAIIVGFLICITIIGFQRESLREELKMKEVELKTLERHCHNENK